MLLRLLSKPAAQHRGTRSCPRTEVRAAAVGCRRIYMPHATFHLTQLAMGQDRRPATVAAYAPIGRAMQFKELNASVASDRRF